ncbi:MAG: DNA repair protein RecN [Alphaproteobacteria bacterium]|nr:DNA repair protein RecN [Alphaproteobacteria bacterium]
MLTSLSIRNVVLIEQLDLDFSKGLSVLTGETGAGKSILLDSMGLALGERAEGRLVRSGCEKASVTAQFIASPKNHVWSILKEHDIDCESSEEIILRRTLNADGRSKAFVNDEPVGVKLLHKIGDALVEIHGQFESHGLLDVSTHRGVLDEFGELKVLQVGCAEVYVAWHSAKIKRIQAEENLEKARAEEELLRYNATELEQLSPKKGEEEELANKRAILMNSEKLIEGINLAYNSITMETDVSGAIRKAQSRIEQVAEMAGGKLDEIIETLDRAQVEISEATSMLETSSDIVEIDPNQLEQSEERLFSMRALARKHGVDVDGLVDLLDEFNSSLASLDNRIGHIAALAKAEENARNDYMIAAKNLSVARVKAAEELNKAVAAELPALKLERASFITQINVLEENRWTASGWDDVVFTVSTNLGAEPAPIHKIASGGELARFMLALKVNLSKTSNISTIVFDEVDTGISGATAEAVGKRLAKLAENIQVLVITHSPQVASCGENHMHVAKSVSKNGARTTTEVVLLDDMQRHDEVARMLSGEEISVEAKAAASKLLAV